jgi:hypothetical protein
MILDVECTVKPWLGNATRMPSGVCDGPNCVLDLPL